MASTFFMPDISIMGEGAMEKAKEYWKSYGKKALVITGKHVAKSEMMVRLKEALEETGTGYIVFDGITGEPTDVMIAQGVELFRSEQCEFCIGIGGGSPLDSAKAIAAQITNEGPLSAYMGKEISNSTPPIVAIPTTAGTGSEATKFTIITDTSANVKMLLKGYVLLPSLAVVDPACSLSAPKSVVAATGLDALTHAIEAYTSRKATPMTDTLALSAIKRIFSYLPKAYCGEGDETAAEQMAMAAFEAGICINNSSVTLVHGMSRPIGALFHVPHGLSNAMLLKECLSFALDGACERFADIARVIGAAGEDMRDMEAAKKMIVKLEELCHTCEVPSLRAYGIDEHEFMNNIDKMSRDALESGSPGNTRKAVHLRDMTEIYKKLWQN